MTGMKSFTEKQKNDIGITAEFVETYCAAKHRGADKNLSMIPGAERESKLCSECRAFMDYAVARRINCPLEPQKPACKHCTVHCYETRQREKAREIMSFSGRRLILKGRVDYIWRYFF